MQKFNWNLWNFTIEIAFQWVGAGCGWCPHGRWCQWSTKIQTYMAFGYYASLFPSQNIKVKTVIVTFLSHNLDFYYWNCEFMSCNSDFIRIVRYCKFTIARKRLEFWDKVTITLYPLYSMAEISFHRFHMWGKNKQTNKHKNAQSNTVSHSSPLPLLPFSDPTIPLPLPGIIFLSLWFCVVLNTQINSKRYFLLYVVDTLCLLYSMSIPPTETWIS